MRTIYIAGNWKMNQNLADIDAFFAGMDELGNNFKCETWIASQAIHMQYVMEKARTKKLIKVGAQNISENNHGAFTGENSAESVKDLGAHFTLIGHSERRALYGETSEICNKKIQKALENDLKVIYCVGETLEEREAGNTMKVIQSQLKEGFTGINLNPDQIVIAYEPVWAIGTGKTATPEMAGEVHAEIRKLLKTHGGRAEDISILYGGSVKPNNIDGLLKVKDIDGALVGGASLTAANFGELVKIGSKH